MELSESLQENLVEVGHVAVLRSLDKYPHSHELLRVIRTNAPQIIFLSLAQSDRALEIVKEVEQNAPGIQFVAIARTTDPQVLLDVMRVGIREFLSLPFNPQLTRDCLNRLAEILMKKPVEIGQTDLLYSFLPSKAGSGTSTLAVNSAMQLSRQPDTNTLLMDMDLNSGMVRFMLKLDNEYSITDACEHSLNMDENLWPQLVTNFGALDVIHSGRINPGFRVEGSHIRHLLEFARKQYKGVVVDLSGNMEKYSIEIMMESKRIFLVCTPEIPSLHLAREKFLFLKNLDLGDRVSVLLNRCTKRQVISADQIEGLLGMPVAMSFTNDYHGVHQALTMGKNVDPASELGRQISNLSRMMLNIDSGAAAPPPPKKKSGLADLFSFGKSRMLPASGQD